jgi:hypothetical protein
MEQDSGRTRAGRQPPGRDQQIEDPHVFVHGMRARPLDRPQHGGRSTRRLLQRNDDAWCPQVALFEPRTELLCKLVAGLPSCGDAAKEHMADGAIAVDVKGTRKIGLLPHLHIDGVTRRDPLWPSVTPCRRRDKKKAEDGA